MGFERRGETVVGAMDMHDLKTVYLVLHASLSQHPQLLECGFLDELQDFLHAEARRQGIDGANHSEWEDWLRAGK